MWLWLSLMPFGVNSVYGVAHPAARTKSMIAALIGSVSVGQAAQTAASSSSLGSSWVAFWVAVWGRLEAGPVGYWRNSRRGEGKRDTPETPSDEGFGRVLSVPVGSRAERAGFEPARHLSAPNGLANRRFRPLSHLSNLGARRVASPSGMNEASKPTRPGPRPSRRGRDDNSARAHDMVCTTKGADVRLPIESRGASTARPSTC
jgi:hypothetical protein